MKASEFNRDQQFLRDLKAVVGPDSPLVDRADELVQRAWYRRDQLRRLRIDFADYVKEKERGNV